MDITEYKKEKSGLRTQLMAVMSVTAALIILSAAVSMVLGFRDVFEKTFDSIADASDVTTADLMDNYYFAAASSDYKQTKTISSVLNTELESLQYNKEPEWNSFFENALDKYGFRTDENNITIFFLVDEQIYAYGSSEKQCRKILEKFYNSPDKKSESLFIYNDVYKWIKNSQTGVAYIPAETGTCVSFSEFGTEHFTGKKCRSGIIEYNSNAENIRMKNGFTSSLYQDEVLKNIFMVLRRILSLLILSLIVIMIVFFLIIKRISIRIATPVEIRELMQEIEIEKAENEKKMLVELNRLKTEFLSNVSHELKTPLAVISGYAQIAESRLNSDYSHEEIIDDLRRISSEANQLAMMVSKVLDAARIEENRVELNITACYLDETVSEVASEYFSVLNDRENKLRISISPDIPPVLADRDYLKRIFLNLISNSLKYTDHGIIKISALENEDGFAEITVSDTGSGIDPAILPNLFERYYKAQNSKKGTGLGLYICKNIIELHGGQITAESEQGHGTKFIFTLPVQTEAETEAQAETE